MQFTLSNILSFLRKILSTIDIKVYAVCVFIAAFIWLLMTLTDNYSEEIEFPITYENFPEGMILVSKPTNFITAQVESQGYEIAKATLSNRESVKIDLSKLRLKRSPYGRYIAAIPTSEFRFSIMSQLNVHDVGKQFQPDSIYLVFDSLMTKKLKVKISSNIKYANGYTQYGDVKIIPAYVQAQGPAMQMRKLKYVTTDSILLSNVKEDIAQDIDLHSIGSMVSLDDKSVNVEIKTEKFSEFAISVPVKVFSNVPGLKVKTFPNIVKVTCTMAFPDYKMLNDSSFQITAQLDSLNLLNDDKIILNLARKPASAKSIRLSDESVEYVIISN